MSAKGYEVIERVALDGATAEVLEWAHLGNPGRPGSQNIRDQRYSQAPVRQVRLSVKGRGEFILEAGMLQFMRGRIDIENRIQGSVMGRLFGSMVSGEKIFRPSYKGEGEIWLEPSLGHFLLVGIQNEAIIVDQGTFVACEGSVNVSVEMQKNVSSALFGGEGLFQTKLSGTGLVVLASPVPEHEIVKYTIDRGEQVVVDGNFTVMRSSTVAFHVGKSSRGWLGTAVSGEGLLQKFDGPGDVWVAPTVPMYRLGAPVFHGVGAKGQQGGGSNLQQELEPLLQAIQRLR